MKNILFAIIFVLFLSGCSSTSKTSSKETSKEKSSTSSSTQIVKELYKSALKQDTDTFEKLIAYNKRMKEHSKSAITDLGNMVHLAGGVEEIDFKELNKKDIDDDLVKRLDEKYNVNWIMIMAKFKNNKEKPFFWILDKVDGDYYILGGEEDSINGVLKDGKEKNYK